MEIARLYGVTLVGFQRSDNEERMIKLISYQIKIYN